MAKRANLTIGITVTAALSAAIAWPAVASPLTAQQILSEYNLVTNGNVSTQSDIEGGIVDGGNLNAATMFNNGEPVAPNIFVYGTLGAGPMQTDSYVNLYYKTPGVGNPQFNFNGGHTQYTTLPALSQFTQPLQTLSTEFAADPATAGAAVVNGTFTAPSGYKGIVTFDLTASQLQSDLQSEIKFSGGSGVTAFIVNVTGNFTEPGGVNFNTPQQDALFNFVNATSVTLGNWKTSVLAPFADLKIANGYLDGSVYANTFSGGGELHMENLYDGAVPSAVPEISTWAMLAAGFGALSLAGVRRTRRLAPLG